MGQIKNFLIDLSYVVGLEGDITKDIICIGERVLENHGRKNKYKKAFEAMRIARQIRELRAEIAGKE